MRVTTSTESPTFTSWPVNGVSTTTKGAVVSTDPGGGGVTGAVPVVPPAMPLPNLPTVGPASQLTTSATLATTAARRAKGRRIGNFNSLRRAPRFHRHVTIIDDVRRDQDE